MRTRATQMLATHKIKPRNRKVYISPRHYCFFSRAGPEHCSPNMNKCSVRTWVELNPRSAEQGPNTNIRSARTRTRTKHEHPFSRKSLFGNSPRDYAHCNRNAILCWGVGVGLKSYPTVVEIHHPDSAGSYQPFNIGIQEWHSTSTFSIGV